MLQRIIKLQADALDFAPAILRAQHQTPSPLPKLVLYTVLVLFGVILLWAIFGRLDIIAVAQGKLVPQSFLKIVQPADSGIVKELLVKEGDEVREGQVLIRMDTSISEADNKTLQSELALKSLQLRRIEAELSGAPLKKEAGDSPALFAKVEAQYRERRQAYLDGLQQEQAALRKAKEDLSSAMEIQDKLTQTLPAYRQQEEAFAKLAKDGYATKLMALEKSRDRIEKEQDLRAQNYNVASLKASIAQSEKKIAQITSTYRSQLQNEQVEAQGQYEKLQQDWEKQSHRHALLELKAPQEGIVKDLATHTVGSVVSPGTVLLTLVPHNDPMRAEVWVTNLDAGFVRPRQPVKLKFASYPFQKYGMVEGEVLQVSPDASEAPAAKSDKNNPSSDNSVQGGFRTIVSLKAPYLERDGAKYQLSPGMQVSAEINLGSRTVLEYLLSPIQKTMHEAGRER
ncbi:MAG: HlyD family type I secretion periplasmic adaptor subunit [Burkholderiales bacterium]